MVLPVPAPPGDAGRAAVAMLDHGALARVEEHLPGGEVAGEDVGQ